MHANTTFKIHTETERHGHSTDIYRTSNLSISLTLNENVITGSKSEKELVNSFVYDGFIHIYMRSFNFRC